MSQDIEITKKIVTAVELPDNLEIGTPGKGGVKVYLDFNNAELCSKKLTEAFKLLEQAKAKYDELQSPITPKGVGQ